MRQPVKTAIVIMALSPLVLAAPAAADPGKRVSTGMTSYGPTDVVCFTPEPDAEQCVTASGRFNTLTTPSGNYRSVDRSIETIDYTAPGIEEQAFVRIQYNLLQKNGQDQVEHTRFRVGTTINGVPCTGKGSTLRVKGVIKRYIDVDLSCAEPGPGVTP